MHIPITLIRSHHYLDFLKNFIYYRDIQRTHLGLKGIPCESGTSPSLYSGTKAAIWPLGNREGAAGRLIRKSEDLAECALISEFEIGKSVSGYSFRLPLFHSSAKLGSYTPRINGHPGSVFSGPVFLSPDQKVRHFF